MADINTLVIGVSLPFLYSVASDDNADVLLGGRRLSRVIKNVLFLVLWEVLFRFHKCSFEIRTSGAGKSIIARKKLYREDRFCRETRLYRRIIIKFVT